MTSPVPTVATGVTGAPHQGAAHCEDHSHCVWRTPQMPYADNAKHPMRLVIVRHGETDWTLAGRHTRTTDLSLTAVGRIQAASLRSLLARVIDGQHAVLFSSPRRRTTETEALALPGHFATIDPLIAEYDYGNYEGLTNEQIGQLMPGWDLWRDCLPAQRRRCRSSRTTTENRAWDYGTSRQYCLPTPPIQPRTRARLGPICWSQQPDRGHDDTTAYVRRGRTMSVWRSCLRLRPWL